MPGSIGRVTSPIRANGVGEVVYEQGGVRQVIGARAADGLAIPRGAEVVVLRTIGGIAVVEPSDLFFGDDAPSINASSSISPGASTDRLLDESGRRAAT